MMKTIKALVFDAYGTLFDPLSVASLCDELYPGHGSALSQLWRSRQLEYTWLRSLMGRYKDFWKVTEAALIFASRSLGLPCERATRQRLMQAYLSLKSYPEVPDALVLFATSYLGLVAFFGATRVVLQIERDRGARPVPGAPPEPGVPPAPDGTPEPPAAAGPPT